LSALSALSVKPFQINELLDKVRRTIDSAC
jgi:hypothetical protein